MQMIRYLKACSAMKHKGDSSTPNTPTGFEMTRSPVVISKALDSLVAESIQILFVQQ